MAYKTILVHVDESRHLQSRVEIAARLAAAQGAHLVGAAVTGISRFIRETAAAGAGAPAMTVEPYLEMLQQRADAALESFEAIAMQAGAPSVEKRMIDDDMAGGIALLARYADLTVLGQHDRNEATPGSMAGYAEAVVMNSASPVLMVPYAGRFAHAGENILVAWNASAEATRALRGALALLRRARKVQVAVLNPAAEPGLRGAEPGADIASYLARHGIQASLIREDTGGASGVGNALLSLTANCSADMLVMGCYGHSRFREILLGGVTRVVMESMTVPVLMAH